MVHCFLDDVIPFNEYFLIFYGGWYVLVAGSLLYYFFYDVRRFRELVGEIVTVGSDAHRCDRVGQYSGYACEILKDIFGYVCTFENRRPVFHKL